MTDPAAPTLELSGVQMRYPGRIHAIQDVSIRLASGEFISVVGASGCGKDRKSVV